MIILSSTAGWADETPDPPTSGTRGGVSVTDLVDDVSALLAGTSTILQSAAATLSAVRDCFGWDYGSFWLVSPDTGRLRFQIDSGDLGEDFRALNRVTSRGYGEGPAGHAWQTRDVVFVEVSRVLGTERSQAALRAGVRSAVVVPLIRHADVVGTLDFFSTTPISPSTQRLDALRTIGALTVDAMDRVTPRPPPRGAQPGWRDSPAERPQR